MVGDALAGMAGGIHGSLARRDPWHTGIPGTALEWLLTPRALKCFTKAALAAPALSLWGKKEKEKEERGKEPEVNSVGPTARSSQEVAPAAQGPS